MSNLVRPDTLPDTSGKDDPKVIEPPVDWERAFVALVAITCTGFVSSAMVETWVEFIRKAAGDKPAALMIQVFNRSRSKFMQDFMG